MPVCAVSLSRSSKTCLNSCRPQYCLQFIATRKPRRCGTVTAALDFVTARLGIVAVHYASKCDITGPVSAIWLL